MHGLDTIDTWEHPGEVMKARALGLEVSCRSCHHRQFGMFSEADPETNDIIGQYISDRFCGRRVDDPYPYEADLENQVCKQWVPRP